MTNSKHLKFCGFYELECKGPQMSEAENSLCSQHAQLKTNTTKKGKKKNNLEILESLSKVRVAGKWAGKHVQLPSPVAAHVFVLMQTYKEQRSSELSEHEQSHCLRGHWPMLFLFFLPLHHVFCMKQSVASMSPLNPADTRYAFEA